MSRLLRLLLAVVTLWCLGCDAFERVAESILTPTEIVSDGIMGVESADDCHCVLGHVAVVAATATPQRPATALADFVALPPATLRPAPAPPLPPPVA